MKSGILTLILCTTVVMTVSGCASEPPAPPESAESQEKAQAAASAWTPEQAKKFEELNKEARGEGQAGKGAK